MTCAAIQASKSRRLTRAERLKITVRLLEEEPYSESRSHTFCLPTWCSNLRAQPSPGPEGAAATAANVRRRRLPSIFPPRLAGRISPFCCLAMVTSTLPPSRSRILNGAGSGIHCAAICVSRRSWPRSRPSEHASADGLGDVFPSRLVDVAWAA